MNWEKLDFLCSEMRGLPNVAKAKKLEIGCGAGIHAIRLGRELPGFLESWVGIDLSQKAVEHCQKFGLDAHVADIETFDTETRFQLFIMLDCLEHIPDLPVAAANIQRLAKRPYTVFGNIPLYGSAHGDSDGVERPMDIVSLAKFLADAGVEQFTQAIYGIHGYPYMVFEGVSG